MRRHFTDWEISRGDWHQRRATDRLKAKNQDCRITSLGLYCRVKFTCQITESNGVWTATHSGPDIGPIRVTASTREEAQQKMDAEIHYWLEMCPCTGETYRDIQIELVESP